MSVLDLNGVTDAAERKRLRSQVNRVMVGASAWRIITLTALAGTCAGAFGSSQTGQAIMSGMTRSSFINGFVIIVAFVLPAQLLAQLWIRRHRRRALVDLLRCELRCINCGYSLKGSPGKTCPECGAPRPFPMTGRDTAISDK